MEITQKELPRTQEARNAQHRQAAVAQFRANLETELTVCQTRIKNAERAQARGDHTLAAVLPKLINELARLQDAIAEHEKTFPTI